jgi:hypothetical protein
MTSQQVGLLAVQLAVSLSVLTFIGALWLQGQESKLKFRFFAVRDRLLYLAATGTLPQESMVFKVFYRVMNTYISELETLTIVSFLKASLAVKSELEKENQQRLIQSLRRADPQAQEVVNDFIRVVMDALRYNSPMLNLISAFAHHCTKLYSILKRVPRFEAPVYETYHYYETIYGRLSVA